MATCKDCLHVEACEFISQRQEKFMNDFFNEQGREISVKFGLPDAEKCPYFKDHSRFVELPDVGDYDTVTTIDEAIDHCYQIATSTDESVCDECKAEHMRLCGWLGDLKSRIIAEQALKERESK